MPPVSYPDFGWSGRFSRFMHTLWVVAIAGTIGAVGGGVGVLAVMGLPGGSVRLQSAATGKAPVTIPPHATTAQSAQQSQTTTAAAPTNTEVQTPPSSSATRAPTVSEPSDARERHAARQRAVPEHGPVTAVQIGQRSHAAEDEQAATRNLYDRAADEDVTNPSNAPRSVATRKRTVKRANRPAVAAVPAPPPQGYQRGWRADDGDAGDWRDSRSGPYYARDAWRDRRQDDDYDRDNGPSNPIGGFFGLFGGGAGR